MRIPYIESALYYGPYVDRMRSYGTPQITNVNRSGAYTAQQSKYKQLISKTSDLITRIIHGQR